MNPLRSAFDARHCLSKSVPLSSLCRDSLKPLTLRTRRIWYSTERQWTPHSMPNPSHNRKFPPSPGIQESLKEKSSKQRAYIALGSNLGDRVGWIEKACKQMADRGIKVIRTSSLWETEPMYVLDQGNFINGVCEVETTLSPIALLDELQSIENALGRHKVIDKGPRNIDLDILLYGDGTVDHERLKVPHALMLERELIPTRALSQKTPWKLTQDYLNALPPSSPPLSTLTTLRSSLEPLRPLKASRRTEIMAILNLTPDSFSNEGAVPSLSSISSSLFKAVKIIDIGGQSTAPGATSVPPSEELSRILPLIEGLNNPKNLEAMDLNRDDFAISIDTFHASIAEAAIYAGADIINDISAGTSDPKMLETVARHGKTIVLMHTRGTPQTMSKMTNYPDGLIPTIASHLLSRVSAAESAGIPRWRIILDPGIGFAKTLQQNLVILRGLQELREWPGLQGMPWLVGTSRKKFVGTITGVQKASERVWGTAVTVAACIQGGADIVRIHDVAEMGQVVKMADAIWRGGIEGGDS